MRPEKRSYYGPYFWLGLSAFVLPLVVAIGAFRSMSEPYTKPEPDPGPSGVDHAVWDYLLKMYVADSLVDYGGMERDYLFQEYVRELGQADLEALDSDDARLALLCNAYNAFVISGVTKHDVTESVMNYENKRGQGFFDVKEHILAGRTISLNRLEHGMIREEYNEPRIHFALVCAAQSCPPLRGEAYVGGRLDAQLEDQTRLFANDETFLRYDAEEETLYVSRILKWYGEDFEAHGGYLSYLAERVDDKELREAMRRAAEGQLDVEFLKYDWSLNSQGQAAEGGGEQTDFGSGSIPNE
jgi:hypothetical protein